MQPERISVADALHLQEDDPISNMDKDELPSTLSNLGWLGQEGLVGEFLVLEDLRVEALYPW